jgi:hypothetical protein
MVAMLGCCLGTMALTLATDGLLHVLVVDDTSRIAPPIALGSSGRMSSILDKVGVARTSMVADQTWLVGDMW